MTPLRGTLLCALVALPSHALELQPPEVAKVDWNTRAILAADLDGDGRLDLAFLNNDRARIEILLQDDPARERSRRSRPANGRGAWDPPVDDSRFRRQEILTGMQMFALAAGDLDGDGRPDLAVTGGADPLTILFQGRDGDWERSRTLDIPDPSPWIGTVSIADLDRDGRNDLIVLARRFVLVFHQSADGDLASAQRFPLAEEGAHGLQVHDLNGDDRPDLLYVASKSEHGLRARLQTSSGTFGPEHGFPVPPHAWGVWPLWAGERSLLAGIHPRTGMLQFLATEHGAAPGDNLAERLFPREFSLDVEAGERASYALGDFDGDGRRDLAVGDRRGARVFLLLQGGQELFGEPLPYPSYPGIASLAAGDADGDGRDELYVLSPDEGIGVTRLSPEGRLAYPRALRVDGKPLALGAGDVNGDGTLDLAYLYESAGERGLALRPAADLAGERELRQALPGLRTDPSDLRLLDANQDGRTDVAAFVVQSPLRLLLQAADGTFQDAAAAPGFRPGLLDRLAPAGLGSGDIDGDGRAEMLVAGTGFARALRVTADGSLEVVDQFNARESDLEISAALAADLDDDGVPEVMLAQKGGGSIQVLARDRQGVYRFRSTVATGALDLVGTEVEDLDGNGDPDLLLLGRRRLWWIPVRDVSLRVVPAESYETTLEDMVPTHVATGDLDGDGQDEVIALDAARTHLLEVLSRRGEDDWRSVLYFTIFESDPHYAGRGGAKLEPRELLVADLTGDGRRDLVLLIHDRVLVYPQRVDADPER